MKHNYKTLYFNVEHINITPISEQFRIIARNKTIVLESNRPLFRNKGLKHRRPDWKKVEGELRYASALDDLSQAIMNYLEPHDRR